MPEIKTFYAIKFGDYYLDSDDFDSPFSKWTDMKLVEYPDQLCKTMRFKTRDEASQFLHRCWYRHHLFSVSSDHLEVVLARVVDWEANPHILEIPKGDKNESNT